MKTQILQLPAAVAVSLNELMSEHRLLIKSGKKTVQSRMDFYRTLHELLGPEITQRLDMKANIAIQVVEGAACFLVEETIIVSKETHARARIIKKGPQLAPGIQNAAAHLSYWYRQAEDWLDRVSEQERPEEEVILAVKEAGFSCRVWRRDGEFVSTLDDLRIDSTRVNLEIENGKVIHGHLG